MDLVGLGIIITCAMLAALTLGAVVSVSRKPSWQARLHGQRKREGLSPGNTAGAAAALAARATRRQRRERHRLASALAALHARLLVHSAHLEEASGTFR